MQRRAVQLVGLESNPAHFFVFFNQSMLLTFHAVSLTRRIPSIRSPLQWGRQTTRLTPVPLCSSATCCTHRKHLCIPKVFEHINSNIRETPYGVICITYQHSPVTVESMVKVSWLLPHFMSLLITWTWKCSSLQKNLKLMKFNGCIKVSFNWELYLHFNP